MKQRHIRTGDKLDDDVTVVIRGGTLDEALLTRDALRNHEVYGVFGISVFAATDLTVDELAQRVPLVRFDRLTLMRVGALRRAGLRLEPTGRNPRHFDLTFTALETGIRAVLSCDHLVIVNPYHER